LKISAPLKIRKRNYPEEYLPRYSHFDRIAREIKHKLSES